MSSVKSSKNTDDWNKRRQKKETFRFRAIAVISAVLVLGGLLSFSIYKIVEKQESVAYEKSLNIDYSAENRDHTLQSGERVSFRKNLLKTDTTRVDERGKDYVSLPDGSIDSSQTTTCSSNLVNVSDFGLDVARMVQNMPNNAIAIPSVDTKTEVVHRGLSHSMSQAGQMVLAEQYGSIDNSNSTTTPLVAYTRSYAADHSLTLAGLLMQKVDTQHLCQPVVMTDSSGYRHWFRLSSLSIDDRLRSGSASVSAADIALNAVDRDISHDGSNGGNLYVVSGAGRIISDQENGFDQRYQVLMKFTPVGETGSLNLGSAVSK